MTAPDIIVHRPTYFVPVQLLGLDELGRQQYVCPGWGCGETAYLDEDGNGHCASCEPLAAAIEALMREGYEALS